MGGAQGRSRRGSTMHSRSIALVAAALALLGPAAVAQAQRCEAPRVLLVVDRSSSMLGELPSGYSKWEAARMAVGEVTAAFAESIDFGLQVFPYPNECEPGHVVLDVGRNSSAGVLEALGAPPPSAGNWTPMAQTLDAAADYAPMREDARSRHVILVTDGWQWCSPYDPSTRFTPV